MQEKYILGVTGAIGCGKSHACKELVRLSKDRGIKATYIDFDEIRRKFKIPNDEIRKRLSDSAGFVLFEWAMLVEEDYLSLVDEVLLVNCDYKTQWERLIGGDLSEEELKRRIGVQLGNDRRDAIIRSSNKRLFILDTTNNPPEKVYKELLGRISP